MLTEEEEGSQRGLVLREEDRYQRRAGVGRGRPDNQSADWWLGEEDASREGTVMWRRRPIRQRGPGVERGNRQSERTGG